GCEVVLSGVTSKRIIRMGVESVSAQPCFPVKVAYGHITELIDKKVDYIFLPSVVSMPPGSALNKHSKLCPYVQSLPYQVWSAFADRLKETRILTAPLHLGQGHRLLKKTFIELGRKLGASTAKVQNAMQEAFDAQIGFEQALKHKGREILASLTPGQKLFVLISRPYNGCDEGVNMQLPKKLADLGAQVIPMDMLDPDTAELSDESLHSQIYWSYGQKILRAADFEYRIDLWVDYRGTGRLSGNLIDDNVGTNKIAGEVSTRAGSCGAENLYFAGNFFFN
ncbi:unnamed protein product, partial [marine sediment metagenome]